MTRPYFYILATAAALCSDIGFGAIPNRPDLRKNMTFDAAGILSPDDQRAIFAAQLAAFQEDDVAIVVITIRSMAQYRSDTHDMAIFARQWFDQWQLGKGGNGRGILIIMSQYDRKVRIELGDDWSGKWDPHCQRIIDREVLPRFREKNYSAGMAAATLAAAKMAAIGPTGTVPKPSLTAGLVNGDFLGAANRSNPIPMHYRLWVVIGGALMIVIGFLVGRQGFAPIWMGVIAIMSVYAFWAAVACFLLGLLVLSVMYGNGHCHHSHGHCHRSGSMSGQSSGNSGVGSSGSFSSGRGGASGSW